MPRSKPASIDVAFFASDAGLLLEKLVAAGIVKARDIASARRALAVEAEQLERRIDELKALSQGGSTPVSKSASVKSGRSKLGQWNVVFPGEGPFPMPEL